MIILSCRNTVGIATVRLNTVDLHKSPWKMEKNGKIHFLNTVPGIKNRPTRLYGISMGRLDFPFQKNKKKIGPVGNNCKINSHGSSSSIHPSTSIWHHDACWSS